MTKAIKIENLSKAYQLGQFTTGTLTRDIERWYALIRGKEDPFLKIGETNDRENKGVSDIVWSLKDINLEIDHGKAFGIIGLNGAGKSTLLKILSQVTSPTKGVVKMKGKIASLLEVGTGFHPELTGRENIYINGAILGMRKNEIDRKFDEIVDFSGVERYIDTPVKRYSSGMYVRLAFAVAANLESDILILDEVLAVGDAEFQLKCLGKMGELNKVGNKTVLFVSHNIAAISNLCSDGILLEKGKIIKSGPIDEVIKKYDEKNIIHIEQWNTEVLRPIESVINKNTYYSTLEIFDLDYIKTTNFKYGESIILNVSIVNNLGGGAFSPEFYIYNELGILVFVGSSGPNHGIFFGKDVSKIEIKIGPLNLTSGKYRIALSMMHGYDRIDTWENAITFIITECRPFKMGWEIPAFREGVCVLDNSFLDIS